MTLVRRIAQLVQDLRELDVITEDDNINFTQSGIRTTLSISVLRKGMAARRYVDVDTIYTAIKAEFDGDEADYLVESSYAGNTVTLTVDHQ